MVETFNSLPSNPWAWSFTLLVALLSLGIGLVSISKKKIYYTIISNTILSDASVDKYNLDIKCNKESIDNLTITCITFWNHSVFTITDSDIIKKSPITFSINNGEILKHAIFSGSDQSNNIEVSPIGGSTLQLSFEYLDYKEGGVLNIVHTGDSDGIEVSKKIKGGKIDEYNPLRIATISLTLETIFICSLGAFILTTQTSPLIEYIGTTYNIYGLQAIEDAISLLACGIIIPAGVIIAATIRIILSPVVPRNCVVSQKRKGYFSQK